MIQRNCGRFYTQYCTLLLKRYSPLIYNFYRETNHWIQETPKSKRIPTQCNYSLPTSSEGKNIPHTPICTHLGRCTYCPLLKKLDNIKCNFTEKSYKPKDLPKHVTCELSNAIYLITCTKCCIYYVGETYRALRKRMYEHKASVLKDGPITPVSRHFKNDGHSHKHMQFSVLEWCTPKFESDNTNTRRRRIEL